MAKHQQRVVPRTRIGHNAVHSPGCTDCPDIHDDDPPELKRAKRQAQRIAEVSAKKGCPLKVWFVQVGRFYEMRSAPVAVAA